MPDDPLFDPWSTVAEEPPTTADEPPTTADEPPTPPADAAPNSRLTPSGPLPGQPAPGQQRSGRRWRRSPKGGEMPGIRPVPPAGERLRQVALPHLEALEARLQIACHRTLIDDRPGRTPPTIRFRLIPRPGPFDDVSAVPGSVLEIVEDDGPSVTARFWLDPVAEEPAVERRVDAARLDEAWIDEITLEFVAKALRRMAGPIRAKNP